MFFHRSEASGPTAGCPAFGICHWGEEPPEFWRAAGLECRSSTGLHETDSTLEGRTQGFTCTGARDKAVAPQGAWARPTCRSWRVRWWGPRKYLLVWALLEAIILTLRPGPTQRDKHKEEHTKTHINIWLNIKDKARTWKATRGKQQLTLWGSLIC